MPHNDFFLDMRRRNSRSGASINDYWHQAQTSIRMSSCQLWVTNRWCKCRRWDLQVMNNTRSKRISKGFVRSEKWTTWTILEGELCSELKSYQITKILPQGINKYYQWDLCHILKIRWKTFWNPNLTKLCLAIIYYSNTHWIIYVIILNKLQRALCKMCNCIEGHGRTKFREIMFLLSR